MEETEENFEASNVRELIDEELEAELEVLVDEDLKVLFQRVSHVELLKFVKLEFVEHTLGVRADRLVSEDDGLDGVPPTDTLSADHF